MAGSRGPAARQRRLQVQRESRRNQWIIVGAGAVLVATALIIGAGLIWAVYLPPRAHVLTVGSADFNAGDVADRAFYLTTIGNGVAAQDPSGQGIDSLARQQILLEFGSGLVDPVTDEDVRRQIATRLGVLVTPTPAATPEATSTATSTPTATATSTATAEATATPEFDDDVFADSYANFLQAVPVSRSDFEEIIRAGLIEDRLIELFKSELPEAGDQLQMQAIRTNDRADAQAVIDAVNGGEAFGAAVVAAGIAPSADQIQSVWAAPEALDDRIREVVSPLQAGQISGIVSDESNIGFEVYFVSARTSTDPYQPEVRDQLAEDRLEAFVDQWMETAGVVERDLSNDERGWIVRRVQDAIVDRQREQAG